MIVEWFDTLITIIITTVNITNDIMLVEYHTIEQWSSTVLTHDPLF